MPSGSALPSAWSCARSTPCRRPWRTCARADLPAQGRASIGLTAMARRFSFLLLLPALALLVAGCGHKEETTPVACLEGSKPFLKALEAAPGEVLLRGEATIADCLPENQDPGELATVGEAMIEAATALNAEAREAGGTQQATELGYLV